MLLCRGRWVWAEVGGGWGVGGKCVDYGIWFGRGVGGFAGCSRRGIPLGDECRRFCAIGKLM